MGLETYVYHVMVAAYIGKYMQWLTLLRIIELFQKCGAWRLRRHFLLQGGADAA